MFPFSKGERGIPSESLISNGGEGTPSTPQTPLFSKGGGGGGISEAPAEDEIDLTKTGAYRGFLAALTLVPLHTLWFKVQQVQIVYAVLGALFMPLLALTLLLLNNRRAWVGEFRNRRPLNAALTFVLGLFLYLGFREIIDAF